MWEPGGSADPSATTNAPTPDTSDRDGGRPSVPGAVPLPWPEVVREPSGSADPGVTTNAPASDWDGGRPSVPGAVPPPRTEPVREPGGSAGPGVTTNAPASDASPVLHMGRREI